MLGESEPAGRLQVKICGITNAADAEAAIAAGADALGFNCFPQSKRWLDLGSAGEWIARLPKGIARVAILVNPTMEEALRTARLPFISALQLHGNETEEFCMRLHEAGVNFGKAIVATDASALRSAASFGARTIILDSARGGMFGGTGHTFPWEIAGEFVRENPALRVVLAGGLTPENVAEAIGIVRPFAVDVTSGVERAPGRKDHEKLRLFIAAAHSV